MRALFFLQINIHDHEFSIYVVAFITSRVESSEGDTKSAIGMPRERARFNAGLSAAF